LVRVTLPGGWIECLEVGVTIKQAGPATARLLGWLTEQSQARGFDPCLVSRLGELLAREGVEAIEAHEIPVPLGNWAGHVGAMLKTDVLCAFDALKGRYCAQANLPLERFDALVQGAAQEWEARHASYLFHVAYGRRAAL